MGAFPVTQNEYGRGDFCFRFNKIILPKDGVRGEKMFTDLFSCTMGSTMGALIRNMFLFALYVIMNEESRGS